MKLSQFRYNLPQDLIALYPSENRDESRLMVIDRKTKKIEHKIFKDIIDELPTLLDKLGVEHITELKGRTYNQQGVVK